MCKIKTDSINTQKRNPLNMLYLLRFYLTQILFLMKLLKNYYIYIHKYFKKVRDKKDELRGKKHLKGEFSLKKLGMNNIRSL